MGRPPRPIPIPIEMLQEQEMLKKHDDEEEEEEEEEAKAAADNHNHLSCIILSEISSVLATMRRNRMSMSMSPLQQPPPSDQTDFDHLHSTSNNPLLLSFHSLRRALFSPSFSFNASTSSLFLLRPFLDTIRSPHSRAPVTAAALSSLLAILTLHARPLDLRPALSQVVDAVATCRFDVADQASDDAEAVLLKILHVLLECVKPAPAPDTDTDASSVGLDDHHVCTAVNTCFRIVHQAGGKSHLLQRSSRDAMHELVRRIFARLPLVKVPSHSP